MRLRTRLNRFLREIALGRVVIVILVTTTACGRDTLPPTPSSVQVPSPPSAPVVSLPTEDKEAPVLYRSRMRRDPFRPPGAQTVQEAPTANLTLTGIIQGPSSYYALVESNSLPGMGYVIRENDVIDSAKVVKITREGVVFEVHTQTSGRKPFTRYVQKQMQPVTSR